MKKVILEATVVKIRKKRIPVLHIEILMGSMSHRKVNIASE